MEPQIKIYIDLEDYEISPAEVIDMARVLADSYPDEGKYVASFGFITYKIERRKDRLTVEIHEGYGYHGLYGFDINTA